MTLLAAIPSPINEIADSLGANDLPYAKELYAHVHSLSLIHI